MQSTGMRPDVEIRLIAADGCCSIGADRRPGSTVWPEDVVDEYVGFDSRSD